MSKKKKFIAALSIASIATVVGAGGIYAVSNNSGNNNMVTLNAQEEVTQKYHRVFPANLKTYPTFNYGGLKYNTSIINVPSISDTASSEEVLILYYEIEGKTLNYDGIDFSQYTGLKDLIIVANDLTPFQKIIKAIPSGINLYIGGGCNFGDSLLNSKFKTLYLCNEYNMTVHNFYSSEAKDSLANSSIENIYYNDFIEKNCEHGISSFNSETRSNKNGQQITLSKISGALKYPNEVFYITSNFNPDGKIFGTKCVPNCILGGNITYDSSLNFTAETVDPKVKNIYYGSSSDLSFLLKDHNYGTVYLKELSDYSRLNGYHIDELVTRNGRGVTLDLSQVTNIKAIRFTRTVGKITVSSVNLPENSECKKIYIPNECKESFVDLINNEKLSSLIEYYDLADLPHYYNSYIADDGKEIYCTSSKYSIQDCEKIRKNLDSLHEVYTDRPVDAVFNNYEIKLHDDDPIYSYRRRDLDTIIVPKNMDAKTVLDEYKNVLVTDQNMMTIMPLGVSVKVDSSNYTVGKHGTLNVTITYPDQREEKIIVKVRHLPVEGTIAYVMGEKDICAITKITKQNVPLTEIMYPLMQYYLMESSAEYEVSPGLDTSTHTFICANKYTTLSNTGKLRVLTTEADLVEPESPSPSDPEIPETGKDTDDIDTEGLLLKRPVAVYTPSTIDGSKLFTGVRDHIATYNGKAIEAHFGLGYDTHDNTKDWKFSIFHDFEINGKKDKYYQVVPAKIIKSKYNIGFIEFEDGTIAVEYNLAERYTAEQVKEATAEFLKSIGKSYEVLAIPETPHTEVYEGNYDSNKILIVNSGYNLNFTSPAKPDEQLPSKEGYQMPNSIYYTKKFSKEQALRVLADKLLRKNGAIVKNYEISFNYEEEKTGANYVVKVDGKEIDKGFVHLVKVESEYDYIFTTMFDYDSGVMILDKAPEAPKYTLNDVMSDAIKNFRGLMKPFDNKTTIDFTKEGKVDVDGTYMVGNGSYYKYEYDVEVMDVNNYCSNSKVLVNGKVGKETIKDDINGFFDDIKKKFEENKVFKGFTIFFGTVTGLLLLYGLYIIFKKLYKWLRG